jgi:hypothetical protein
MNTEEKADALSAENHNKPRILTYLASHSRKNDQQNCYAQSPCGLPRKRHEKKLAS